MNRLRLTENNLEELTDICCRQLQEEGSFILIPTETVYGLACLWKDNTAKDNIYKAKERPENKPFQLLITKIKMLEEVNAVISDKTKKIINKFCPGPITIVIPTIDNNKLGFRIPEHKFVLTLIDKLNSPVAATSANISGKPAALDADTALNTLKQIPDLSIDEGNRPKDSLASTVIEITNNDEIILLREGPISFDDILKESK